MVNKKKRVKTNTLLSKINFRTILHSKSQFLAVILITALAMTLYVGLTSNAKSIKDRTNKLYEDSNIADIYVNTSSYDENDLTNLKTYLKDKGEVEERFLMSSKLQANDANALMMDQLPNISKPAKCDNQEEDNFFIIDHRLLEAPRGEEGRVPWTDENGNYLKVPVRFSIASYATILDTTKLATLVDLIPEDSPYYPLKDTIKILVKEFTLMDVLDSLTPSDKTNPLNGSYLNLDLQVSGSMQYAENVQSSIMNTTNYILSKNYFKTETMNLLKNTYEPVDMSKVSDQDPLKDLKSLLALVLPNLDDVFTLMDDNFSKLTNSNQYLVKLHDNVNQDEVLETINNYYQNKDNNNLIVAIPLENVATNVTIQNDIVQAEQLAYIFPVIFFLVAILVVLTTTSQIILKERSEIGTFKALGLSSTKVTAHYLALSLNIVFIGILLGIIAGPFIIPLIMNQKYDILYTLPSLGYTVAIPQMIISTLVVLLLTGLVTYFVVRKETKLKPIEGMRPKERKIAKLGKMDNKPSKKSIPIRMALRNIKLNISKSLMVVLGIAGCTSLLVCGFGIDDTLNNGINKDIEHFYSADIYSTYNSNNSILDDIKVSDPNIEYVEEYTSLPTSIYKDDKNYHSLVFVFKDESKFFKPDKYSLKEDIVVSNKIAKELDLKVGDEISFTSLGMSKKGRVGYILDTFYMHGIYLNEDYNTYSDLAKVKTNAWASVKDQSKLLETMDSVNNVNGVSSSRTYQESVDLINQYMSSISYMTLAVKVFAILLAIVVLYNLVLLNFKERTRDIATLKVLGFSRLEISNSLFFESFILTFIGVFIGLFFGLPMEILVLMVNQTPLVEFLYTVFPLSYVISSLLTLGTAILVNALLTLKIKDVKMVESLKSVE